MERILTSEQAALADEGVARLEAAILRSVAEGVPLSEAIERHVEAVFTAWPHAAVAMALRFAERGRVD